MHVFGYGESQMIGEINGSVSNEQLTTISPLLDYLSSIQQPETVINSENLLSLTIASGVLVRFTPNNNGNKFQDFTLDVALAPLVEALAFDIQQKINS